jgi:hypothetical protein
MRTLRSSNRMVQFTLAASLFWGKLQKVVALAKLTVEDKSTKQTVGRKLFGVPVVFARSPRREPIR